MKTECDEFELALGMLIELLRLGHVTACSGRHAGGSSYTSLQMLLQQFFCCVSSTYITHNEKIILVNHHKVICKFSVVLSSRSKAELKCIWNTSYVHTISVAKFTIDKLYCRPFNIYYDNEQMFRVKSSMSIENFFKIFSLSERWTENAYATILRFSHAIYEAKFTNEELCCRLLNIKYA